MTTAAITDVEVVDASIHGATTTRLGALLLDARAGIYALRPDLADDRGIDLLARGLLTGRACRVVERDAYLAGLTAAANIAVQMALDWIENYRRGGADSPV